MIGDRNNPSSAMSLDAEIEEAMNGAEYWARVKIDELGVARDVIQYTFHIPLSLSDKMFLAHYADEFITAYKSVPLMQRLVSPMNIGMEIAGKFLMVRSGMPDVQKLHDQIYGRE